MKQFTDKTIVVPWDFSVMAKDALAQAFELANSADQIEVIHVTPYPAAVEPSVVWGAYSESAIQANLEKSFREEVTDPRYASVKFTAVFGDPGSRIAELAKKSDAGLVVISSHGRTGLTRMVMGSVAERVVRLAPCPVLVLRE